MADAAYTGGIERRGTGFNNKSKSYNRANAKGQHTVFGFANVSFSKILIETTSFLNRYLSHDLDDAGCKPEQFTYLGTSAMKSGPCVVLQRSEIAGKPTPAVYHSASRGQKIGSENIFAEGGYNNRPGAEARLPSVKLATLESGKR